MVLHESNQPIALEEPLLRKTPVKGPRIFYGWYILGITTAGGFFAGATSQAVVGLFLRDIESDTGWSRSVIAGAVTTATFASAATAAIVGRIADRSGPRLLMTIGALLFGLAYIAIGFVTQAWHLYAAYTVARFATVHLIYGVVPRTAVVHWFRRLRGRTLGIAQMSQPLGGSILALLAGVLLSSGVEWRQVFMLFGAGAIVVLLIPTPLLMRRRPEDMGLLPDGDVPLQSNLSTDTTIQGAAANYEEPEISWTFREALSTKAYWLITSGMLMSTWASGGVSFHMSAYFGGLGLHPSTPALAVGAFLMGGALSSSIWGFLTEHYSERILVVGANAMAVVLTVYAHFIFEPIGAIIFAALYGATARGEGALLMIMMAQYYGKESYGAISGFATQFSFAGLAIGPLVFSLMFDLTGSYHGVFNIATIILLVAVVALWMAKEPTPKPKRS